MGHKQRPEHVLPAAARCVAVLLAGIAVWAAAPVTHAEVPALYWLKDWRYGAAQGPASARAALKRTGAQHLLLARDRSVDPLGGDCDGVVSYGDLQPRGRTALATHFGHFWRFPADLDTPGTIGGWVRCDGENEAAVAFRDARHGYRFFEDGPVIPLY